MAIAFTVKDTISQQEAPVQNVDENITLQEFLKTLEQSGFGPFSELSSTSAIEVDQKFTTWDSDVLPKKSLAGIGITDGAHVTIHKEQKVA
jgi:hypothetical protein